MKRIEEQLKEYEDSLKAYRDVKNSIDTALEKGREEGMAEMQRMPEVHPEQEQLPEDKTAGRGLANGAVHLEHGR